MGSRQGKVGVITSVNSLSYIYTVELLYLELGYLELPAISNLNPCPLDLPLLIQSFILGYLELPGISNYFLFPLAQINPVYLEL